MDVQAFLRDITTLGGSAIGPLKGIITVLAQVMVQILQFIIQLLNLLLSNIH